MDKFFLYIQFGGCVAFALLTAMLAMSRTFESKRSYIYKRARWMLILSQALLAIHFWIQFYTGWREIDPTKAIMLNMIFFPLSGMLMLFSLSYMFTKGEISHRIIYWSSWTYIATIVTLLYGYRHSNILYMIETINAIAYTAIFTAIAYYTNKEFKNIKSRLDNYFSKDTTTQTDWLAGEIITLTVFMTCVPFAVLSNSMFLKCITLLNFATIIFYINRFIYYTYDVQKLIDLYFEVIEADTNAEEDKVTSPNPAVETAIKNWIEKKRFTNPELTIEDLVKETSFNRSSLTNYINGVFGQSFRSWLNSLRISEAKAIMIKNPEYSHETVADMTGFSSRTYFIKVFKDKEGLPPVEWMEKQKQNKN